MKTLLSSVNYLNSQDSTGLTDVLKKAVKQLSDDKDMWQKCNEMANMFLTHRQVKKVLYKLNKSPTSIWEGLIKLMQVSYKIWPFPFDDLSTILMPYQPQIKNNDHSSKMVNFQPIVDNIDPVTALQMDKEPASMFNGLPFTVRVATGQGSRMSIIVFLLYSQ